MKLVKTTTYNDSVVLTNREFDGLHEPDSQLTILISKEVGNSYHTVKRIENADIPYSLTHIKRIGYGIYEGKKVVYFRELQSRKPRAKKQFCLRGHDTFVVGRNATSGACNECAKLHTKASNLKTMLANAQRKLAVQIELQGLNPDTPPNA